jgi:hypothetical protein
LPLFPNWQHTMTLQVFIWHQRYFVAFFGECESLQELAIKAPMIFVLQRPDYPFVHWQYDWHFVGFFLVSYTSGFSHGSIAIALHIFWIDHSIHRKSQIQHLVLRLFRKLSVTTQDLNQYI